MATSPPPPPNLGPQPDMARIQQLLLVISQQISYIEASLKRIPMQLYNATASSNCQLQYPAGVVAAPFLPKTKMELIDISVEDCNKSFVHLGLPALPETVPTAQRQQVLIDFLGCALLAEDDEDDEDDENENESG